MDLRIASDYSTLFFNRNTFFGVCLGLTTSNKKMKERAVVPAVRFANDGEVPRSTLTDVFLFRNRRHEVDNDGTVRDLSDYD